LARILVATTNDDLPALALYQRLFQHRPRAVVVDLHPDYRSTLVGRDRAQREGLPLVGVQHHHDHIAAVLADNGWPLDKGPVLGIALDGLGFGPDGTLWGGELLIADYRAYRRVGWLRPTPMPGGTRAILEPWRNLLAQIESSLGWESFLEHWPDLEVTGRLAGHPLGVLRAMMARGLNAPLSSSAGRLCDAVAAALGVGGESITYEGQAAIELETLAAPAMADAASGYPLRISETEEGRVLDPAPLWPALLDDLGGGRGRDQIAARFHVGLCEALAELAAGIAEQEGVSEVALSGGVFQNRLILEGLCEGLRCRGLDPLTHGQVPANDGGLSLGQAVVAAARNL
jgi:hydrogenase maturation protein HypF